MKAPSLSPETWTPAYIALGSNLGQPSAQITLATQHVMNLRNTRLMLRSSLYKSTPLGPQDQPDFINAVVAVITQLSAIELLTALQSIEQRMGRVPPMQRWGARVIDLDILLHGDSKSDSAMLRLPHPEMHKRNFVMMPLAEIAPMLAIPGHGLANKIAIETGAAGLEKLTD